MSEYPAWKYSVDKAVIVKDADEAAALEGNWYDSPADIPDAAVEAVQRAALIADAEAKGVKIDKRWSDARIADEIEKACARIADEIDKA